MRQFNTFVTTEPCAIVRVDLEKMTLLVKGFRNLGEVELPWTDYSCVGLFPEEDAHWGGRVPEVGTRCLVLAEWTNDAHKELINHYLIGYLPTLSRDYAKEGYSAYRSKIPGGSSPGDHVISTSARSFYKMSSSGNIVEECTPGNYRRRSPAENAVYDVADNRHTHIGGYVEKVTHNEVGDLKNKYARILWTNLPKDGEFNTEEQKAAALADAGNIVIMEECGGNLDNGFSIDGTKPVYKFSIINNGNVVYSKVIEADGNVYEDIKGTQTQNVTKDVNITNGADRHMTISGIFTTIATGMQWAFDWAEGAGNGAWNFVADTVEYVVNKIDFRSK